MLFRKKCRKPKRNRFPLPEIRELNRGRTRCPASVSIHGKHISTYKASPRCTMHAAEGPSFLTYKNADRAIQEPIKDHIQKDCIISGKPTSDLQTLVHRASNARPEIAADCCAKSKDNTHRATHSAGARHISASRKNNGQHCHSRRSI